MLTCGSAAALALFVNMIYDPEMPNLVEFEGSTVIINATEGTVIYEYVEEHDVFCIDGEYTKKGDMLGVNQ